MTKAEAESCVKVLQAVGRVAHTEEAARHANGWLVRAHGRTQPLASPEEVDRFAEEIRKGASA